MNLLFAICAGIALAAACGFRVFLPLLFVSIATRVGWSHPSDHFAWLGSNSALVVLGVATVVEIAAYYIPWLDHALDIAMSPTAVGAGALAAAALLPIDDPAIKWALAIIAGGGTAGFVQAGTVATRAVSGATTAGLGNPVVSTIELIGSIILSILAIVVPVLGALFVLVVFFFIARRIARWRRARSMRLA